MLTFQWLIIGGTALFAVVAFLRARRAAKRLDRLTESYWELRYEHGQLRSRVKALEPPQPDTEPEQVSRQAGTTAFVPLSSLKR